MPIDYDKLQKLWKQLGIENNIKWKDVEGNVWEDFQLGRTPIYFNGEYDNSSEGFTITILECKFLHLV